MIQTLVKILGVASIGLSFALTLLLFKIYRVQRSPILLGLPLGFLLLAASYAFLGLHLFVYTTVDPFSSLIMWLRVTTQTAGFALITYSYFLSGKLQKSNNRFPSIAPLILFVILICLFGLLLAFNPSWLTLVYSHNEVFTVVNLFLVSYIVYFIVKKLESTTEGISGLISAPVAFAFIWLGQFSFLIWELDGAGRAALIGSQIAPMIGLILFIRLYYLISKRSHQAFDG